ncbi:MAG: alkyl sulfatase dimerization domain-containing protein, partial [Pseudomonadota bacterium]
FHNALTLRGAKARDTLRWAEVIDEVLVKYGDKSDLVFASHHWPTWGGENVERFLRSQRDVYRYAHDQTLRQANGGATMVEAAEALVEPDLGDDVFDTRGYYGTLNHNAKAIYQFYFGWWDGVPATYHTLPPVERASRMVEAVGGADEAITKGRSAFAEGDYRWAAELFNAVVFDDPDNRDGREWLAATYEQLGFQAESGAWRSYYLTGAKELRDGIPEGSGANLGNEDFLKAVPTAALFNALAVRYQPDAMKRDPYTLNFRFTDTDEQVMVEVGGATVFPRYGASADDAAATFETTRESFNDLILGKTGAARLALAGKLSVTGDRGAASAFFDALEQPETDFNVVTP